MTVVLLGALLGLGAQTGYPAVAAPDPAACQQYNSHGICVVQAESAEQPATRPIATASGNGDGRQEALCTLEPTGDSIPCQEGPSWWVQSLQCYAQLMPEQPSKDSPIWGGRTDGAIYVCTYYTTGGAFPGTNGFSFWSWSSSHASVSATASACACSMTAATSGGAIAHSVETLFTGLKVRS